MLPEGKVREKHLNHKINQCLFTFRCSVKFFVVDSKMLYAASTPNKIKNIYRTQQKVYRMLQYHSCLVYGMSDTSKLNDTSRKETRFISYFAISHKFSKCLRCVIENYRFCISKVQSRFAIKKVLGGLGAFYYLCGRACLLKRFYR